MIQTEGYDPSVSITTTVAMKPGGKLHNVCKMQRTVALKGQIFRFTCPTCGHSIDVWNEMADGREFTCGGETCRAYPPL